MHFLFTSFISGADDPILNFWLEFLDEIWAVIQIVNGLPTFPIMQNMSGHGILNETTENSWNYELQ